MNICILFIWHIQMIWYYREWLIALGNICRHIYTFKIYNFLFMIKVILLIRIYFKIVEQWMMKGLKTYIMSSLWNDILQMEYVKFEDTTKIVIKNRKLEDRQYNDQKKNDRRTNNDLQNTTQKTKDRRTRNPLQPGGELKCSERVSIFCSTCWHNMLSWFPW